MAKTFLTISFFALNFLCLKASAQNQPATQTSQTVAPTPLPPKPSKEEAPIPATAPQVQTLVNPAQSAPTVTTPAVVATPTQVPVPVTAEPLAVEPKRDQRILEKIELKQEIKTSHALKHNVIRRVTMFPFFTNGDYKQESEVSWWKSREYLSETQRFLVSTKRYLEQKDVFQPRKSLKITDSVLLSQILDSDCLITGYIENKKFIMEAYSGQDGQLLWTKSLALNAAKPVREQLEDVVLRLTRDFIATIPYHGFQIVDPLNDKAYTSEGENIVVRIDVGAKSGAQPGQKVQWIDVERTTAQPLFQGGSVIRVIAEGEVVKNENQVLTVNVKRAKDLTILNKKAIVHIPDEYKRLTTQYAIRENIATEASVAYLSEPMVDTESRKRETRPLLTALASIANVILVVLLAL